jgi:hypothetical protein
VPVRLVAGWRRAADLRGAGGWPFARSPAPRDLPTGGNLHRSKIYLGDDDDESFQRRRGGSLEAVSVQVDGD